MELISTTTNNHGLLYDSVQVDWLAIFLSSLALILPATARIEVKGRHCLSKSKHYKLIAIITL